MEWTLFRFISGFVLLLFGRRLFWLFVGILGFLAGFTFASRFFEHQQGIVLLAIAVGCGVAGILLAFFLQKLAIVVAGFLAGGLFGTNAIEMLGIHMPPFLPFLIGGILGAILLAFLFDWALIFLTSVTGAMQLSRVVPLEPMLSIAAFVVLLIAGIVIQARSISSTETRVVRST